MTVRHHYAKRYDGKRLFPVLLLAVLLLAGCTGDETVGPDNDREPERSTIHGIVADEEGHTFPGVPVTLRHAGAESDLRSTTTDTEGSYRFANVRPGDYAVSVIRPRRTEIVDTHPAAVAVAEGATAQTDFTIRLLPVDSRVVGEQGLREDYIGDASGEKPARPDEPLYHANHPEALHPIIAPDGHHVTSAEWQQARGTAVATCDGARGTHVALTFEGLIPNAVYSVGAVLVDWIDGAPVRAGTGALGASNSSQNVFTASSLGEGMLEATTRPGPMSRNGSAPECMLTQVSEIAIWLTYHIDGEQPSPDRAHPRTWVDHLKFEFGRE